MSKIDAGKVVAFRYIMKNHRGEMLENTMNGKPTIYLHGTKDLQQLLQDQLTGLQRGDRKNLYLLKDTGLTLGDFCFEVIIDNVRDASAEELMLGYPLQGGPENCDEDCACYKEK